MSDQSEPTAGLHSFERNNYFYGKLLTVRDMATEQAYHSGLRRTLSRYVTGSGGVCGLDVETSVATDEDADQQILVVTVTEGLALDRCGRLVVVSDETTKRIPLPATADGEETDTVGVFVEYDECYTDPVPVAKTESACETECCDNTVVQSAEVTVEPGDPGVAPKPVAEVEFPDPADLGIVDDRGADRVTVEGVLGGSSDVVGDGDEGDEAGGMALDLAFAEGATDGTATANLTLDASDRSVTGRVTVPDGQVLDDEGVRIPDGEFELTGSFSYAGENDERTSEFVGELSVDPGDERVAIGGTLDDPDSEGEFDFDLSVELTDGGFAMDEAFPADGDDSGTTTRLRLDATVTPTDGDYLLGGELSVVVVRGTGSDRVEHTLFTIHPEEWERDDGETIDGLYVDVPRRSQSVPTDSEIDHLLTEMARSYYDDERVEACPETDDGRVPVGTITRTGEAWASTTEADEVVANATFERGPLAYTNDMLYDVLARHVTDFENPHDVALEVGDGPDAPDVGPDGAGTDASVGVEGPDGPTGTVGLTSSDGSIDVTTDRATQTLDFTTDVGVGSEYETYHVFEKSLWQKVEAYTDLVRRASNHQVPQEVRLVAMEIVNRVTRGLEERVYESPETYVEFLLRSSTERVAIPTRMVTAEGPSIVDLERQVIDLVDVRPDESDRTVGLSRNAIDRLAALLEGYESNGADAADIAMAQDRVAEAARLLLVHAPTANFPVEGGGGRTRIGRASVPDVSTAWSETRGQPSESSIRSLWRQGWVHQIDTTDVDGDERDELGTERVNAVVGQSPDAGVLSTRPRRVRLDVVDPPSAERIDGIGPNYAAALSNGGIDSISELSVAQTDALRVLTGVSQAEAEKWSETARGYTNAYSLTRFDQIGSGQAEALYEAREWTRHYQIGRDDVDPDALLDELRDEVANGDLDEKHLRRIEEIDWNALWDSIDRLEG